MQRQNLVIPHPFAIQTQSCPMARRDKLWSFCTLLSTRGGGPDDMQRQNLVIPHPFAIQTQPCPMARRDKIWSFCTLLMQSYPARALDRKLQVDWAKDAREGPRVLMSLRVDFRPMG